jgi:Zn-dependent M28 family amino/carboxypeptidase
VSAGRRRRPAGRGSAPALVLAGLALSLAALPTAAPAFDGQAAFRHVGRLVAIGPRPAGSPGAARAREYIVAELKKTGARVRVDAFEADTPHGRLGMANVIGVLPGRRPDIILVGGHYDTKWFPDIRFVGANDGGSSTGLLLELARALAARPRAFTYWVVFFDGEEARVTWSERDSLYGSRRLAEQMARSGSLPRAVLVADMIGDRDLAIRREAHSTPWLTDLVWQAAARLGHGAHFRPETLAVEDDHVPFLRRGVPATLLIDFDFPPWHTAEDTLDTISARSLQVVGEVLLEALADLERRLGPR